MFGQQFFKGIYVLAQACRADEGLTTNRTNNNVSTEFWGILMNET